MIFFRMVSCGNDNIRNLIISNCKFLTTTNIKQGQKAGNKFNKAED